MVLLVSYDLGHAGRDYTALKQALESTGAYWHHLDSTWLVVTQESAEQLRDRLTPLVDRRDRLLVLEVVPGSAAWSGLPKAAHDWLTAEL